jgi:hypothetical protein
MRVKPTKFMSFFGLILSILFCLMGFIYIIPLDKVYGIIWVIGTIIIAIYYAINLFTSKGLSLFRMDIDSKDNENKK